MCIRDSFGRVRASLATPGRLFLRDGGRGVGLAVAVCGRVAVSQTRGIGCSAWSQGHGKDRRLLAHAASKRKKHKRHQNDQKSFHGLKSQDSVPYPVLEI